jgi:site-specific DNA recombinase
MRTAIYARYSSDNQRDASIEDQLRLCRLHVERQGWMVVDSYSDRAISGASLLRPGIQELIADAAKGRFDTILTESLDRLSRDQEDIAGLYKRMRFAGVKIVTLSEGEVSELHIGLKGTMGALYLKDLADKTRRGLRGRVEAGKSGGGNSYGYDVVRAVGADGQPMTGERKINQAEAEIVRRIFGEYVAGKSSRAIAWALNNEGIPGPFGREWGPSTIHGNPQRGTGILNNELYIGKILWNRLRYIKDPDTGKRVSRLNPESEWVIHDVPQLRIIDQDLWNRAKKRQNALAFRPREKDDNAGDSMLVRRRPKHLLAGLVHCSRCGGGYTLISKGLLGCATARNKGTCSNRLNIRRDALEASVLSGLRTHLMAPDLYREFCEEFTRAVNQGLIERRSSIEAWKAELKRIDRDLEKLLQLYLDDAVRIEAVKEKGPRLEARKKELQLLLADAKQPPALLHPNMAEVYRQRIAALHNAMKDETRKVEAFEVLRSLVSGVILEPVNGELAIHLKGDLAAMLTFAANKKKPSRERDGIVAQLSLVAGVGFEPTTFRL